MQFWRQRHYGFVNFLKPGTTVHINAGKHITFQENNKHSSAHSQEKQLFKQLWHNEFGVVYLDLNN